MTAADEPEQQGYELVMPFVACGPDGPFDSAGFGAGFEFQRVWSDLQTLNNIRGGRLSAAVYRVYIDPKLAAQFDLAAMDTGFKLIVTPTEYENWAIATFVRDEDGSLERLDDQG